MANKEFFPQRPESHPMIYAYPFSHPQYKDLLKVGYTEKQVERRVPYRIVLSESAKRSDGTCFTDHDVHQVLRRKRVSGVCGG